MPLFADLKRCKETGAMLVGTTSVPGATLDSIVMDHPSLPEDYIEYLREVGWGALGDSCYMVYSGPIGPDEIYGEDLPADVSNLVFFGDDFSGYCAGFIVAGDGTVVEIEPSTLELEPTGLSFGQFIRRRIAACEPNVSMTPAANDVLASLTCCTRNRGADEAALRGLEEWVGKPLPTTYREFMSRTNGVEGFVAEDNYLMLWPAEQISELNQGYCVSEFAPGLLFVGSNGGDAGYAFDTRSYPMPVLEVPFIGLSHGEARVIAPSFEEFIKTLHQTPTPP